LTFGKASIYYAAIVCLLRRKTWLKVIPCLDVKDGRVVKGVKFVNLKDAGDPAEIAGYYSKAGADEIVFSIYRRPLRGERPGLTG